MSNLDIFKIAVGPSSSHTLGPLNAANDFVTNLDLKRVYKIKSTLYGSLSLTGRGHLSDMAIIWGLAGLNPRIITPDLQENIKQSVMEKKELLLNNTKKISFDYEKDMIFTKEFLSYHPNAMKLEAFDEDKKLIKTEIYYSTGGGFITKQSKLDGGEVEGKSQENKDIFEVNSADELLFHCKEKNLSLSQLSLEYELQFNSLSFIRNYCKEIWHIMQEVYQRGINPSCMELPGRLRLHRRAKGLHERIKNSNDPLIILDFLSLYAISIAEENAAGAQVVTAPTNGACAVIPAVMLYLHKNQGGFGEEEAINFLLAAMLIGSLYKKNASISGAEAGCQAEIGAASSMAAAAMADFSKASPNVACAAAESAMEHHLGLTCDPVAGLVQIPCIERNAFGAIKAVLASRMCMERKSTPKVTLDEVIRAMRETGKDMNTKYKETSLGGLASVC